MLYKTHQVTSYTIAGLIYYQNYAIFRDNSTSNWLDKTIYTFNQWIANHVLHIDWLNQYQRLSVWQGKAFIFGLLLCVVIGALVPDIDHPNSKLGRHMPKWFTDYIPHRTFTHSLLLYLPIILLISLFLPKNIAFTYINALLIGACLHIIEDYFSVESIHLFYPINGQKRTKYSPFRYHTGKTSEQMILLIMTIGAIIVTIMWLSDTKIYLITKETLGELTNLVK